MTERKELTQSREGLISLLTLNNIKLNIWKKSWWRRTQHTSPNHSKYYKDLNSFAVNKRFCYNNDPEFFGEDDTGIILVSLL